MGKNIRKYENSSSSSSEDEDLVRQCIEKLKGKLKRKCIRERARRPFQASRPCVPSKVLKVAGSGSSKGLGSPSGSNRNIFRQERDSSTRESERSVSVRGGRSAPPQSDVLSLQASDLEDNSSVVGDMALQNDPLELEAIEPAIQHVLGNEGTLQPKVGDVIHTHIAQQWKNILMTGIQEDTRNKLLLKYPPIKNCPLVEAPKLNKEIKLAVNEPAVRRDNRMANIQNQIGASLAALGQALTLLLGKEISENDLKLIELVGDAGRMLCDVHHAESESRKKFFGLLSKSDI
ncbi:hypothetical protein NQ314_014606 [Rhamnusium bicolor]|uniref:Uncharacterized protein n=1 Tax=Rhamnusium bicolor TaxID=1586634 RepID=A0AAV8X0K1_9CUCU|nr:hypothetical protein NQ314_014606 [Rhamnusium bicolor]